LSKNIITISNLSFKYDDQEVDNVLTDISLTIKQGEWISIVGHNGSGKSTLAKFFNGLLTPTNPRTVEINGIDTVDEEQIWEVRKQIGMVFQNPDNQMVATTVRDDVAFGLENIGVERNEMKNRITWALEKVKMENYLNHEPYRLSGGQKQRVAIAGIIAMLPSVIILDEATSMLDPMGRKEVLETVSMLNKEEEITVINITHDLEETVYSDRLFVMNKGRISIEGVPKDVFQESQKLIEAGLELPFSMQLQSSLANKGIEIARTCLTKEVLVNELWKLKSQT
jgi:energy-coupling factor transport system ATP-binding protein